MNNYIIALDKVFYEDLPLVGGKNASLGELTQQLRKLKINVPGGFVLTVAAYQSFLNYNKLEEKLSDILSTIDYDNLDSLRQAGRKIRQLISNGRFPKDISGPLVEAYYELSLKYGEELADVAVRSSATAEDLPEASFAGQQESFLNVKSETALIDAVRSCYASLFTDRAISYRHKLGYDHLSVGLSVCVQKMVRTDLGTSGVAFSIDPESGFKNVIVINASYGLGELLVQGAVNPDEYIIFKPLLGDKRYKPIIDRKLGSKQEKLVYSDNIEEKVKRVPVAVKDREQFCLVEEQLLMLAAWVKRIEDYYTNMKGSWCPVDIEWGIDGRSGALYILQARPETIHSRKKPDQYYHHRLKENGHSRELLIDGIAVGEGIAYGQLHQLSHPEAAETFKEGEVLLTDMTDPDWEPLMSKASAIVTNRGGRTCHAAIIARELGIPAIVGCGNATKVLQDGQEVTVCCAEGERGRVYAGLLPFETEALTIDNLQKSTFPLKLNIASPELAFKYADLPHKGVGLAREEFIINNYIGLHPMAVLKAGQLKDETLVSKIYSYSKGFESPADYFVNKLSYGMARIAAAFYPEQVIVRFSDFKTNEYGNLAGGQYFEPEEENPMIGWRGASRYYSSEYREAFGLECMAIRKVREEMGLDNVAVMVPFCRTPEELYKVKKVMCDYGLRRAKKGLKLYLMAELPANVLLVKEFARQIDGLSIGSNDLTQLTLGLDRDSALVAALYDERNKAVKKMISMLVKQAKAAGVEVGICGQAPSDFPDFTDFLIKIGIDSISVTPDAFVKTQQIVAAKGCAGRIKK